MFPIFDFLPLVLKSFLSIFGEVIFWIPLLIVGLLYRKMTRTSLYLFGTPGESPWRLTLIAAFFGILGGFLGSCLLIFVGISVNEIGGIYLLFTALGLMLIQQRFLCFAYAGGVLSLCSLLLGFPQISVPHVMALVAVLHLVEALLIYFTGSIAVLPIYVSTKEGKIVGGYNLQKFWPMPLIVLFAGIYPDPQIVKGIVSMPDWWPLLKPGFTALEGEIVYSLLAIPAVLGYGDIALSTTPREKTRVAGWELAGYSIILLFLAVGASYYPLLAYPAALFGPLGHELVIYLGQKREAKGTPLFAPSARGVKLLYVQRKSPLAKVGVKAGDILLTLNGFTINEEQEIREIKAGLPEGIKTMELEYLAAATGERKRAVVGLGEGGSRGYIPVPEWHTSAYLQVATSVSPLRNWWRKMARRFKG
ncbi:MAG: PDZ domain-containing protein [Clostridia bacterium]|nr:PDZ domain-containing protein [Clostridia bacterium]